MDEPQYRDIPAAEIPTVALQGGGFIKVIAGEGIANQLGPVARDDIGLVFLDVFLPPHARLAQPLPEGHTVSRSSQTSKWSLAAAVTTRRRWCANARSPCSKKEIM